MTLEQQYPRQAAIARCLGNLAALREEKGYEYAQHRARSSIRSVCQIFARGARWDKRKPDGAQSRRLYNIVRMACYIYLECPGSKPVISIKEYSGRLPC